MGSSEEVGFRNNARPLLGTIEPPSLWVWSSENGRVLESSMTGRCVPVDVLEETTPLPIEGKPPLITGRRLKPEEEEMMGR